MATFRSATALLILSVALASPAVSQNLQPPSPPGLKVGVLGCAMSPTIGLVFGALQTISCRFTPDGPYPPEAYVGTFGTLGVDVGIVAAGTLAWGVYNGTSGPLVNALAGTYVGGSASAAAGLGVGVNVLFGGSNRTIALQPISVEGEAGIDVEGGISTLVLRAAY
jgi:hypothetical protein